MNVETHTQYLTGINDPVDGAINRSDDGSRFTLQLNRPLQIPRDAVNVMVSAERASVWFSTPNIVTGVNDQISIIGRDTNDVNATYNLTLPQGLYSLTDINREIQTQLADAGAKVDPTPLLTVSGNETTSRVELTFEYNFVSVDFTGPRSIHAMLGFNAQTYGPYTSRQVIPGDNIAQISPVEFYLVSCSLVDDGIRIGDRFQKVIAQVFIDVPTNSQIQYHPRRPAKLRADLLKDQTINAIDFQLLDHRLRPANTGGETWSVQVKLSYQIRTPIG